LIELRAQVELVQGKAFDQGAFYDFILGQGLLPPSSLSRAVMKEFAEPGEQLSGAEGINTP
jgi:uncharacterized protein (DUF885 family)